MFIDYSPCLVVRIWSSIIQVWCCSLRSRRHLYVICAVHNSWSGAEHRQLSSWWPMKHDRHDHSHQPSSYCMCTRFFITTYASLIPYDGIYRYLLCLIRSEYDWYHMCTIIALSILMLVLSVITILIMANQMAYTRSIGISHYSGAMLECAPVHTNELIHINNMSYSITCRAMDCR